MSCGVGCRHGLDPLLLWLWCRPAAVAPIRFLPWEPPYTASMALKSKKKKKKKKKNQKKKHLNLVHWVLGHKPVTVGGNSAPGLF